VSILGKARLLRISAERGDCGRTPGAWNLSRMLQVAETWPMNCRFPEKGNTAAEASLEEQIEAEACGLKLHEDWGTMPAAIDTRYINYKREPRNRRTR
jgi:urease alpha subunit